MKRPFIIAAVLAAVLTSSCAMEIELYPPKLSVIDYNLTMISCVTRFNSNETEPSIYFLYNEIGITAGFNYATQTNNGLSPPRQVPCPPLYADNRRCTASLMYIVGNPTINGSSLMCTAVSNKTRQADSTTVTINVMTAEGEQNASPSPLPSPSPTPSPLPSPPPSPSPTPVGETPTPTGEGPTETPRCDCNCTNTGSSTGAGSMLISVPVVAGFLAAVGVVFLLLVVAIIALLVLVKTRKDTPTDNP